MSVSFSLDLSVKLIQIDLLIQQLGHEIFQLCVVVIEFVALDPFIKRNFELVVSEFDLSLELFLRVRRQGKAYLHWTGNRNASAKL